MNHHSLALTVSICAALLALISAMVWSSYKKHHYLLWLSAALLLASGGYLVRESAAVAAVWREGMAFVLLLGALVALVQAMVMRFGRRQFPWVTLVGAVLMTAGVASAYQAQEMHWIQQLAVALGTAVILAQVLPVARHSAPRHRMEQLLLLTYACFAGFAIVSPWGWGDARWWMHMLSGALVLLGAALLPTTMILCVLADGVPSSRSSRDEVTRLLTADAFAAVCGDRPSEQSITVLVLCSLDQLPWLREQHGARTADRVLAQFAQLLQTNLRDGDWVARISGDEFGMALRHIGHAEARQLLQRIRLQLRQQPWLPPDASGPLTACFGLVAVQHNEAFGHVLHRAYVLLCQAKESGNDCLGFEEQAQEHIVPLSHFSPAV